MIVGQTKVTITEMTRGLVQSIMHPSEVPRTAHSMDFYHSFGWEGKITVKEFPRETALRCAIGDGQQNDC